MNPRSLLLFHLLACVPCAAQTALYNFGNPNADEQEMIELINRARANPPAEGARLAATTDSTVVANYTAFSVDLALMQTEFNQIAAAPPIAPNGSLTQAARGHSSWMLANAVQSHNQSATNNPGTRITAAGYSWNTYGENIGASVTSGWHAHAGFQVDWGPGGTGGMQPGRGHRTSIHNATFREVGVGVVRGSNTVMGTTVGPRLVTQDFGRQQSSPTFATGVAYYDLDGDSFYDPGEGIAGIRVDVVGASYYCESATGGGWVVPVPSAAATRIVSFSGLGVDQSANLIFTAGTNAKLDLKLAYAPPAITSSATAYNGVAHTVTFNAVPGATGYQLTRSTQVAAPAETCESVANVTTSVLGGYQVLNAGVVAQGARSFHLVNASPPGTQWIELNTLYRGQTGASISFQSRLRYATPSERYKMQVKEEGTGGWQDAYDQAGTNAAGESSFSTRTCAIPQMAGKNFRVRFLLDFTSGSYYGNSGNDFGWFIDNIQFANIRVPQNLVTTTLSGTSGTFTPSATGSLLLEVAPLISGTSFPAGIQTLTVTTPPTGFAGWALSIESANGLPPGTISANPQGDRDGDGHTNLMEYAFGTSPVVAGGPEPRYPVVSRGGASLVVDYQADLSLMDLTYIPEASAALGGWKAVGEAGAPAGFTVQNLSTSGNIQSRRAILPLASGDKGFVRVRVVTP